MKNDIQESRMITLAAPAGGLASGTGVVIGNLFGIASRTALVGEQVAISTEGTSGARRLRYRTPVSR